jgi:hypothetical protein
VVGVLIFFAALGWLLLLMSTVLMHNTTANGWAVAAFASIPAVLGMILGAAISTLARKGAIHFACSACGKPIPKTVVVCPNCGASLATTAG